MDYQLRSWICSAYRVIAIMPSNSDVTSSRLRAAVPTATLQSWPLRDEPVVSSMMAAVLLVIAAIVAQLTGHWITSAFVFALLGAASWQQWLPVTWDLGPKGLIRTVFRWRQRIAWSEFSHYEPKRKGVMLLHYSNHSPFRAVSGLFLPSHPPHSELIAVLDHYLKSRPSDPVLTTQTLIP